MNASLSPSYIDSQTLILCLSSLLVAPAANTGLALINNGLGRSRSAAHAILSALCVTAVASIIFAFVGSSWSGFAGGPVHSFMLGGKPWNWIASAPLFLRGIESGGPFPGLVVLFQIVAAGLAAMIPLGTLGDRWRLRACCFSTAILAGITYPFFAHWTCGGGWLSELGANFGLGRGFVDPGGAGSIHVLGGLTALSLSWIVGSRRDKFSSEGVPAAIPGHNLVFVIFGCFLAWTGWLGLNSLGAMLFSALQPARVPLIAINTTVSASGAGLAAAVTTRIRFGRPDPSLVANGWVGGLVVSSVASPFVPPLGALLMGTVAGVLVTLSVEWLELQLVVDDPAGAISVHAVAGMWGLLAVSLFGGASGQWLAQLVGVATLLGFVLPLSYSLNWLLDRVYPQRVAVEGERQGMDLHELGASAYPEFVIHREEFLQR